MPSTVIYDGPRQMQSLLSHKISNRHGIGLHMSEEVSPGVHIGLHRSASGLRSSAKRSVEVCIGLCGSARGRCRSAKRSVQVCIDLHSNSS